MTSKEGRWPRKRTLECPLAVKHQATSTQLGGTQGLGIWLLTQYFVAKLGCLGSFWAATSDCFCSPSSIHGRGSRLKRHFPVSTCATCATALEELGPTDQSFCPAALIQFKLTRTSSSTIPSAHITHPSHTYAHLTPRNLALRTSFILHRSALCTTKGGFRPP